MKVYHIEICPYCRLIPLPGEDVMSTFTFQLDPQMKRIDFFVYPHTPNCPALRGA